MDYGKQLQKYSNDKYAEFFADNVAREEYDFGYGIDAYKDYDANTRMAGEVTDAFCNKEQGQNAS